MPEQPLSEAEMKKYFGTPDGKKDKEGVLILDDHRTELPRRPERGASNQTPDDNADDLKARETRETNKLQILAGDLNTLNSKVNGFLLAKRTGTKDNFTSSIIRDMADAVIDKMDEIRKSNPDEQFDDMEDKLTQLADGLEEMGMGTFANNYIRPKNQPLRKAA